MTEGHCVADPGWLDALVTAAHPGVSEYGFFGATVAGSAGVPPLVTGANVAYYRSIVSDLAAGPREGIGRT